MDSYRCLQLRVVSLFVVFFSLIFLVLLAPGNPGSDYLIVLHKHIF